MVSDNCHPKLQVVFSTESVVVMKLFGDLVLLVTIIAKFTTEICESWAL